jgi:hypothetical protein
MNANYKVWLFNLPVPASWRNEKQEKQEQGYIISNMPLNKGDYLQVLNLDTLDCCYN